MAEQDASHGSTGEGFDSRYFGPFGPSQPDSAAAQAPGPAYAPAPAPIPPGYPTSTPPPPPSSPPPNSRRNGPRAGAVIGIAALTAAVVGAGAGYGGARLAGSTVPSATSAASTPTSAGATPTATATAVPPPPPVANTVAVAKKVVPSTVVIKVGRATGSGFVLDSRGRIMTNNHVVARAADGAKITVIFANGRRSTAKLVGRSPSYDIAVVKVNTAAAALRPVQVGDSAKVEVGQPVIAIGAPLGLPGTVTQGIVSAHNRPVVVRENADADTPTAYIDAIQTDAPINPGNSGGPLVDAGARIIGVNSAILTLGSTAGQTGSIGLGFAIPINQAVVIGNQLIKRGTATYPVLGADVAGGRGGVELTSVERSGPANRAGLRKGDVVTRVDGKKVAAREEFIVSIRTHRPGDKIELKYTRGSAPRTAQVRLGSKEG